jgi:hypothetical protein
MITVKQAVASAIEYVDEFGHLLPRANLRLEETEFEESTNTWLITLSFSENLLGEGRTYKLFRVDAETGQIKSMTSRQLAA